MADYDLSSSRVRSERGSIHRHREGPAPISPRTGVNVHRPPVALVDAVVRSAAHMHRAGEPPSRLLRFVISLLYTDKLQEFATISAFSVIVDLCTCRLTPRRPRRNVGV